MEKIILDHPWIILLILLWTLPWKAAALWKAARRNHLGWFLTLIILNTFAILDIIYIFFFSGPLAQEKKSDQDEVRQAKMQRYREKQMKEQQQREQLEKQQENEPRQANIQVSVRRRSTVI